MPWFTTYCLTTRITPNMEIITAKSNYGVPHSALYLENEGVVFHCTPEQVNISGGNVVEESLESFTSSRRIIRREPVEMCEEVVIMKSAKVARKKYHPLSFNCITYIDYVLGGNIGKIYDTQRMKPNSRVDRWWQDELSPGEITQSIGRSITLHDWHTDPEQTVTRFNLYGIEFGNWMNQQERLIFLAGTAQGLNDLSKINSWTLKDIGLAGTLSITLGSRGFGGTVAAFYMGYPYELINLTKTMGPGALAHEYGHAIDFFAAKKLNLREPCSGGRTVRVHGFKYPGYDRLNRDQKQLVDAYQKLFEMAVGTKDSPTEFGESISNLTRYWRRRVELWARIYEKYTLIRQKELGLPNRFLQNHGLPSSHYPTTAEIKKLTPQIRRILKLSKDLIL